MLTMVFAAASVLMLACQASAAKEGLISAPSAAPPNGELRLGDPAPDFVLRDQNRQEVRLSDLRGRPVQIAFYVWALSSG